MRPKKTKIEIKLPDYGLPAAKVEKLVKLYHNQLVQLLPEPVAKQLEPQTVVWMPPEKPAKRSKR